MPWSKDSGLTLCFHRVFGGGEVARRSGSGNQGEQGRSEKSRIEAKTKRAVADSAIAELVKKKVPEGEEAEKFLVAFRELEDSLKQLRIDQHDLRKSLADDDEKKKSSVEKQKLWEEEEKALADWRKLRELIGSADGKKFPSLKSLSLKKQLWSARPTVT